MLWLRGAGAGPGRAVSVVTICYCEWLVLQPYYYVQFYLLLIIKVRCQRRLPRRLVLLQRHLETFFAIAIVLIIMLMAPLAPRYFHLLAYIYSL